MIQHASRIELYTAEDASPLQALTLHHYFILKERLEPRVAYTVLSSTEFDAPVLGFFQTPLEGSFYRRTTGGDIMPKGEGWILGIVFNYRWRLKSLLKDARDLALCVDGHAYGVTKIAKRAVIEILGSGPNPVEAATKCLNADNMGSIDPDLAPDIAIRKLSSIEWKREPKRWNVESDIYGPGDGHYIRFRGFVEDGVLYWVDIDGVFHATPPGQVIALIDNIVHVIPNRRLAYDLGNAWTGLIETAGIEVEHVIMAMEDLVEKAESYEP